MANIKSAIKRARQNEKRRLRNRSVKSAIKTAVKKVIASVEANDRESAHVNLLKAIKILDRAAAKGVIHKNTSARKKSRLAKKVNALAKAAE
ncbi:MAG: 30S ribosomal protein S20 [bacterium]